MGCVRASNNSRQIAGGSIRSREKFARYVSSKQTGRES